MFIRGHLRLNFWFGQINYFNTRKTFSRVYYEHKCKCVFIVAVQIPTSLVLWSTWAGTCLSGQFCHCPPVITSWPISQKYLGFFVNKIFWTSYKINNDFDSYLLQIEMFRTNKRCNCLMKISKVHAIFIKPRDIVEQLR